MALPYRPGYLNDKLVSWLLPLVPPNIAKAFGARTDQTKGEFQRIDFQFFPQLEESEHSAEYSSQESLHRTEPYQFWSNSSGMTFTLNTQFVAIDDKYNVLWVQDRVSRLQALTKPIYSRDTVTNTKLLYAPPVCLFTYGSKWINVPVIVTSVSATKADSAQITNGGYPFAYEVSINLTTTYPYGYVPGYLDWIKTYEDWDKGLIKPGTRSFNGKLKPGSTAADPEGSLMEGYLDKYIVVDEGLQIG